MTRKSNEGAPVAHRVLVGPAGWSYADWKSIVYPVRRERGFREATYLAQFFDTIEINTSFYQPPKPDMCRLWIEHVAANPRFLFSAKLWQKFTHEEGGGAAEVAAVREGFDVLAEAGRLGAVLMQFPFSFHNTAENFARLQALAKEFGSLSAGGGGAALELDAEIVLRMAARKRRGILQYRSAGNRKIGEAHGAGHFARRLRALTWPAV